MSNKPVKVIDADVNILGIINQFGQPLPTIVSVGNYASKDLFPIPGQEGVIYIDATKNRLYRWDLETEDYIGLAGYSFESEEDSPDVVYSFKDKNDKTFTTPATSISLIIPENATHGFEAGCVVKTGDTVPAFSIINESATPLKMIQYGTIRPTYIPATNSTITFLLYNDKINNNLLIYEVADT